MSTCRNKKNDNSYLKGVISKATGEISGTCCFGCTNKKDEWGFGYNIKQECLRKGYATEIVKVIIKNGCSLEITDFISDCTYVYKLHID